MSFERRFTGSNDEPEIPLMLDEMAKAFEEAFKPEPTILWYCWRCDNYGENIVERKGKHFCGYCGRFASKDVVCEC